MINRKGMRLTVLFLILALLLAASGCSANSELSAGSEAKEIVAVAGDYEIPYETLYYITMNKIADMKSFYGKDVFNDPAKVEELKTFVSENLFGYTEAMILVGRDYGIALDDSDIAEQVQNDIDVMMANQFEDSRDSYVEMLNKNYLTDRYFRTYIAVSEYMTESVLREMLIKGEIDDSDEAARLRIYGKDFARVIQVFIDPQYYASDEAAKAKAESLQAMVAAATGTARLDAMYNAKQYSLDTDTREGLYIIRGEMNEVFDEAVFALDEEAYGVSEVMYLNGGYCFVLRAPLNDDYVEENFEELKQKSYYLYLNQKVERYIENTQVKWTEYGSSLDLLDLPVLEADGGEWVYTLLAVLIVGGVVVIIALLVRFLPDRDKKRKKGKGRSGKR